MKLGHTLSQMKGFKKILCWLMASVCLFAGGCSKSQTEHYAFWDQVLVKAALHDEIHAVRAAVAQQIGADADFETTPLMLAIDLHPELSGVGLWQQSGKALIKVWDSSGEYDETDMTWALDITEGELRITDVARDNQIERNVVRAAVVLKQTNMRSDLILSLTFSASYVFQQQLMYVRNEEVVLVH